MAAFKAAVGYHADQKCYDLRDSQVFSRKEFVQMDAPILSSNAAENSTELFATEYFDRSAFLSQSGQLYGEAMAMAQGKIYTFGPTFRAENRRHGATSPSSG